MSQRSPHPSWSEAQLLVRVASLYYQQNLTQQEIGDRLGLSRIKINRLLKLAVSSSIVQVTINAPPGLYPEFIQQLCQAYPNLRDVIVVPEADDGEPLYRALVEGALAWLQPRLRPGLRVGLGMGRTVSHLPRNFQPNSKVDCTFIEIIGGAADQNAGISTYNVTAKMAELIGGRPEYLNTPTIVSSPAVRQSLLQENTVAAAFERARRCDIALQSVGPVDRSALLHVHSYLTDGDLKELKARGVVGDVLGWYLDADGQSVPGPLDGRVMGLTLDEIKRLPLSVLVAGGRAKVPIMRAALRAQLFNVLITDTRTATGLLI